MNNLDRLSIIAKLEMLNQLCNEKIGNTKESIELWKNNIKESEDDVVTHGITCKDMLNSNMRIMNFYEGVVNENNRLINMLEEELNLSEEYRLINMLEENLS